MILSEKLHQKRQSSFNSAFFCCLNLVEFYGGADGWLIWPALVALVRELGGVELRALVLV